MFYHSIFKYPPYQFPPKRVCILKKKLFFTNNNLHPFLTTSKQVLPPPPRSFGYDVIRLLI
jgi:hypothetical protein